MRLFIAPKRVVICVMFFDLLRPVICAVEVFPVYKDLISSGYLSAFSPGFTELLVGDSCSSGQKLCPGMEPSTPTKHIFKKILIIIQGEVAVPKTANVVISAQHQDVRLPV
jgi:hypothetical protein